MRALAFAVLVAAFAPSPAVAKVSQPAAPSAVVVLVPGSGFNGAGVANAERMSFRVGAWRRWGFRTRIAAYRAGKAGLTDVTRAVHAARNASPGLPVCVYGESSGGTWALLVAARTADVACVVALAAPADQETLAASPYRRARHLGATMWPRRFGSADEDDRWEPYDVWSAAAAPVPVLLGYSRGDRTVPPQQGRIFAPVAPESELRVLRRGTRGFVHARVRPEDLVALRRAARALVEAQTTSP